MTEQPHFLQFNIKQSILVKITEAVTSRSMTAYTKTSEVTSYFILGPMIKQIVLFLFE